MDNKNYERAQRFGAYIRALRLASNLTQQELATKCGYTSRSAMSRVEKGLNDVDLDRLPLLASALGVDVAALVNVYDNRQPDDETAAQVENVRGMLNDLTPAQLQQVAAIIKVMQAQNDGGAS